MLPDVVAAEVPPERIRTSLATYRWLFGDDGWAAARAHAPAVGAALAAADPRWLDELGRWATAAGCDLDDLLVLNARSEVLSLVRAGRRRGECTVVARPGQLGQTWDWFGRQRDAVVVLRGEGFVTVTEAGMLAKLGVNRHGVAVGLTYLASGGDRVAAPGALPVHAVLRLLLERATSVAHAVELVAGLEVAGSACIPLADRERATLLELAPGRVAELGPGCHTNHFLDPGLAAGERADAFLDDSLDRLARARALGEAPLEVLLADRVGGFHAIDQGPDPSLDDHDRTETVLAVVADPARRSLRISPGRPGDTGFGQEVSC